MADPQLEDLTRQLTVLREAISPFQRWVDAHTKDSTNWVPDGYHLSGSPTSPEGLTAGDVRRLCEAAATDREAESGGMDDSENEDTK